MCMLAIATYFTPSFSNVRDVVLEADPSPNLGSQPTLLFGFDPSRSLWIPACFHMANSSVTSLLLLPSEVLLIILNVLRPAKRDCWARRFRDSPPAKKDWDALRCSCRALRELVGSCITRAVITPSCKHSANFPSHAVMTQLCIKGECGVLISGNRLDVLPTLLHCWAHSG